MQNDIKKTFRWIILIPGSLIGGFLATFPLHWMLYVTFSGWEGDFYKPIEHFLSPIVIAYFFIMSGYEIAPRYKLKACIVLAILWIGVPFCVIFFWQNPIVHFDLRTFFTELSLLGSLWIVNKKSKEI